MMLQALPEALLRASYKQCLIDAHIEVEVEEELNYPPLPPRTELTPRPRDPKNAASIEPLEGGRG